ncbi:hypothetical protein BET10_00420 [Pseudoalteromonas amylolytica]|uniref:Uncharacterized protein n=2 Tax=Pseudoalteromonas TaxID=53246 RepID=A0A1S1MPI0_9GAMM|nr:hypothetical protein BFC16_01520 [Pseudoalteromonas sp. JW3]OHU87117.1 hypothetical protein BET10_00420 [Pseudoalteromonas amylolytica]
MLTLALTACGGSGSGSNSDKTPDTSDGKTPVIVAPEPEPEPQNKAPVILAAQGLEAQERDVFSLAAQASDDDGSIKSFVWEQTAGTTVELSGTDTNTVQFIAPDLTEDETITLKLSVTDDDNETTSKEFVVAINAYAQPSADVITDKALLMCMNDAQLDMGATAIECTDAPISSLAGIETLTQLVSVKFENTQLESLEMLGTLTQLENLTLHNNPTTDYSALNNLTALKSLSINVNTNSDLPDIDFTNFQNLTSLTLQYNDAYSYNNLDLLKLPTSLTELHLSKFGVDNASALSSFSQLEKLSLEYTSNVNALSFLAKMPNIKEVTFAGLNVNDPTAFSLIPDLEKLALRQIYFEDFSFLANLTKLTSLAVEFEYYQHNRSFDVNTIKELSELTTLSIGGIQLENTSGLSSLTNLTALALNDSNLTTLSFLANLDNLTSLMISNSPQIIDIGWIAFLPELTELSLDSLHGAVSYEALAQLTSLTHLNILYRNTHGSSLDMANLSQLSQLEKLTVQVGELTNISSLSDLTRLQYLFIHSRDINELPNISALSQLTDLSIVNHSYYNEGNQVTFANLGASSSLTNLRLNGFSHIEDLTALAQYSALEELEIRNSKATNITPISQLDKLKKLTLSDFQALIHVADLASLNKLEFLAIYSSPYVLCADLETLHTTFADTTLLELSNQCIESLVDLSLIEDENLKTFIRNNKYYDALALKYLSLYNSNNILSLAGMEQYSNLESISLSTEHAFDLLNSFDIEQLSNLNSISISYGQLTTLDELVLPQAVKSLTISENDATLDLQGFNAPYIEYLNLSGSSLSNTQLLANFTNLTRLNVSYTNLEDLTPLHSLTQLEFLSIYQYDYYECEQIEALTAALPNTYIEKYSSCN